MREWSNEVTGWPVTHQKLIGKLGKNAFGQVQERNCYFIVINNILSLLSFSFILFIPCQVNQFFGSLSLLPAAPTSQATGLLLPWGSCKCCPGSPIYTPMFHKHFTTSVQRTLFSKQNALHLLNASKKPTPIEKKRHTSLDVAIISKGLIFLSSNNYDVTGLNYGVTSGYPHHQQFIYSP